MDIRHGAQVVDKNGRALGPVGHMARNLSTGELKMFIVRRRGESDLFISPEDVSEATEDSVQLKTSLEELQTR